MAIRAELEGNLTKNPEGKYVQVGGENRMIVEMRVFSDVNRRTDDGWEQDDDRSGGVDVTIWNEKLAKEVLAHFKKGARVLVLDQLHLHNYEDEDGVQHAFLRMAAETVGLQPYRIEGLTFRPSKSREETAGAPT
ncbi:MAG: single-stranded DNA-binding protein [Rubrivivax sp.]